MNYIYIIDTSKFEPEEGDFQWSFHVGEEQYNGVKTERDLSNDGNVVVLGDYEDLKRFVGNDPVINEEN